ncbi:hypothetical protein GCM10009597_14370 [Peribacillus frigoritolerans]
MASIHDAILHEEVSLFLCGIILRESGCQKPIDIRNLKTNDSFTNYSVKYIIRKIMNKEGLYV